MNNHRIDTKLFLERSNEKRANEMNTEKDLIIHIYQNTKEKKAYTWLIKCTYRILTPQSCW